MRSRSHHLAHVYQSAPLIIDPTPIDLCEGEDPHVQWPPLNRVLLSLCRKKFKIKMTTSPSSKFGPFDMAASHPESTFLIQVGEVSLGNSS